MKMPIYYVSNKLLDQINHFRDEKIKVEDLKKRSDKMGFGIKSILTFFGNTSRTQAETRITEMEISAADRFLENFNKTKLDISPLTKNISLNEEKLYSFKSTISLEEEFGNKGNGTFIQVSGNDSSVSFRGTTSIKNWSTESLLNSLLYSQKVEASGIFVPLTIDNSEPLSLVVQFLVICHPAFSFDKVGIHNNA